MMQEKIFTDMGGLWGGGWTAQPLGLWPSSLWWTLCMITPQTCLIYISHLILQTNKLSIREVKILA